jgi:hypothetical protein
MRDSRVKLVGEVGMLGRRGRLSTSGMPTRADDSFCAE